MGCNVIGITIKQMCEAANVNYNNVLGYKNRHPELTIEACIEFYKNKSNKTFTQKCKEAGLSTNIATIRGYRSSHPELTDEEVIAFYKNGCKRKRKQNSTMYKCEKLGINYSAVVSYKSKNPELSYDDIIEIYKNKENKEKTLKQRCEEHNLSISAVRSYKSGHKLTDDEVINYFLNTRDNKTFKQKCDEAGVKNYDIAVNYRTAHKDLDDEQVIKEYLLLERKRELTREKREDFKKKCINVGLNFRDVQYFWQKFNELDNEEIIKIILNTKNKDSFAEKCRRYNIDIGNAYKYKQDKPELSEEEVIIHYRPDCYINIFGEIIILEEEQTK